MKNAKRLSKTISAMKEAGEWDLLYSEFARFMAEEIRDNMPETKKDRKVMVRVFDLYSDAAIKTECSYVYE